MTLLTYIGGLELNKCKLGSKAYLVFRRGTTVIVRWGPVEMRGVNAKTLRWARKPQERPHPCGSVAKAKAQKAAIIDEKTRPGRYGGTYSRVARGVRVLPRRRG